MIVVVNSGIANLSSVMAALNRLNAEAVISADPTTIKSASHVILPGVGAASAAMATLNERKLVDTIRQLTQPVLGICLGMQIMFEQSSEGESETGNKTKGIGIIPGTIEALKESADTPVPHMGWNQIRRANGDCALLKNVNNDAFVYFVHSFAAPLSPSTLAITDYGRPFTAIVGYKNFYGCQFHPERSSVTGHRILRNFLEM